MGFHFISHFRKKLLYQDKFMKITNIFNTRYSMTRTEQIIFFEIIVNNNFWGHDHS